MDFITNIPKYGRTKWFNLPRVELDMKRMVQSTLPGYDWLPDQLNVSAKNVFVRDRKEAQWLMKPKPWSVSKIDSTRFLKALENTVDQLGIPSDSRVQDLDEYFEKMNKHSSSCFPLYRKKSDPTAQDEVRSFVSEIYDSEDLGEILRLMYSRPVTTFHRFSPKVRSNRREVECKIRLVFGYAFDILALQEMLHGDSIQKVLETLPITVGLTRPEISDQIKRMREDCFRNGTSLFQGDIQGMDYRLSGLMILLSHAFMIEMNRLSGCVDDGTLFSEIEKAIALYELRTPVIGSWDRVIITNGGTLSGTRFNTFANSLQMTLATEYHYQRMNYSEVLPTKADIILTLKQSDDVLNQIHLGIDSIIEWSTTFKFFHMQLHPEKSKVSGPTEDADYLGMTWTWSNVPIRNNDWIVSKIVYPERFLDVDFRSRFLLRSVSILSQIANGIPILLEMLGKVDRHLAKEVTEFKTKTLPLYQMKEGKPEFIHVPWDKILMIGWRLF